MSGGRRAAGLLAGLALLAAVVVAPVRTAIGDALASLPVISNFGREVDPAGRLVELSHYPVGAALTPDGRYLWTVGAGPRNQPVRIVSTADGATVQDITDGGKTGGIVIAPDGRRAYLSSARDRIQVYALDPDAGTATEQTAIELPPPKIGLPPDELPPRTPSPEFPLGRTQSYPEHLALTPDGRTLVAALNLSDEVAIVDVASRAVTRVKARPLQLPSDRAYPLGVAIAGRTAFVTDEGDGSLAVVPLDAPDKVRNVRPAYTDPRNVNPAKTHPSAIVAAPDGRRLYVALTNADQVLEVDAADPSRVLRRFEVGRPEGLGSAPVALSLTGDGRYLFVANSGEGVVRVIDLATPPPAPAPLLQITLTAPLITTSPTLITPTSSTATAAPGEIARIPAGIYPIRVFADERNQRLHIMSLKGLGPGATEGTGEGINTRIRGLLQTLDLPADPAQRRTQLIAYGAGGDKTPVPVEREARPPSGSPLSGPDGLGPSPKIKYVFYVVMENKTFDQVLGDLGRGDGDPCVTLFGETRSRPVQRDGSPCPPLHPDDDYDNRSAEEDRTIGERDDGTPITPNAHRLARRYVTLDRLFSNAETSDDGHIWTAGAYATDYELRNNQAPARPFDVTLPIAAPPKGFLFDSAVRQGVSLFNYGEAVAVGTLPDLQARPDDLAVRGAVIANSEFIALYPSSGAIDKDPITGRLTYDREPDFTVDPTKGVSRMAYFRKRFQAQLAACAVPSTPALCAVPRLNELLFPNNHTSGTTPGGRTPDALNRDGDQAVGQLIDDISHSKIWPYSAIFVVQDDAQDGVDHFDGHRMTGLVISPWAKREAVDSTRYDQLSVIRTMQIILGMRPTYLYDALATPMWNSFTGTPDFAPYDAFDIPEPLSEERNGANAPLAATSQDTLWVADAVDEGVMNKVLWAYRSGSEAACVAAAKQAAAADARCSTAEAEEAEIGHARGRAILAQLRAWDRLMRADPAWRSHPQLLLGAMQDFTQYLEPIVDDD